MMAHLDPALHCLNTRLEKIEDVQRRISKYYTTCEHQLKEVILQLEQREKEKKLIARDYILNELNNKKIDEVPTQPVKRKRGRPRKGISINDNLKDKGRVKIKSARPNTPERVLARHHGSLWLLGYIVSSGNKNITVQFDDISDQRLVHKSESIEVSKYCARALCVGVQVLAEYSAAGLYYSAIVGEIPSGYNAGRNLLFFDDGNAKYVPDKLLFISPVQNSISSSASVIHRRFISYYVSEYLRDGVSMLPLSVGDMVKTELNGEWVFSQVINIDCSIVLLQFPSQDKEWVYRGSYRLEPIWMNLQAKFIKE